MNAVRSYRDLLVWQKGVSLVVDVYRATASSPAHEQIGLTGQVRRAAVSIPANLAEGHTRARTKDFQRFISMALGSLAELETHLIIAQRLSYLTMDSSGRLLEETAELGRMLHGLYHSLEGK